MPVRQSSLSREYLRVEVSATENGVAVDPTGDLVQFAFQTDDTEPTAWETGGWETADGKYFARILIGPGGTVTLTDGKYRVWLKITDSPEAPVRQVGVLTIT